MGKYISLGQFNKYYFFILGSISVKLLNTYITGFYPELEPNKPIHLFGFTPQILAHPLIRNVLKYFAISLGGLILEFIFFKKTKDIGKKNEKAERNLSGSSSGEFERNSLGLTYDEIITKNNQLYLKNILIVFFAYYFGKTAINALDNFGFHPLKLWPLEFLALLYYSKKIIEKKIYKHQRLSLSITIIFSTLLFVVKSFIPESNENCPNNDEECQLLTSNVYSEIIDKLNWLFIPIFIFIYLLAMTSDAYANIKNKWFIDFKYISIFKILSYLGVIGFIFSLILLSIFSYIPCSKNNKFSNSVCYFEYEGHKYYDNFKTIMINDNDKDKFYNFYLEIFLMLPLYLIFEFLSILFDLLIIDHLDPFYLIPIDTCYFIIYQTIDFCITLDKANLFSIIRFIFATLSDLICVLCCSIYLEIFELHFHDLDKDIRRNIILRGIEENKSTQLIEEKKNNNNKDEEEKNNKTLNLNEEEGDTDTNLGSSFNKIEIGNYYTVFDENEID